MNKKTLSFLANGGYNSAKDQVVLHAICNIVAFPYQPIMNGITPNAISNYACKVFYIYGIRKQTTWDIGNCSVLIRELLNTLVTKGVVTLGQVQAEIDKLFETTYSDPEYISAMGPF